jgi:hypothetical protein
MAHGRCGADAMPVLSLALPAKGRSSAFGKVFLALLESCLALFVFKPVPGYKLMLYNWFIGSWLHGGHQTKYTARASNQIHSKERSTLLGIPAGTPFARSYESKPTPRTY